MKKIYWMYSKLFFKYAHTLEATPEVSKHPRTIPTTNSNLQYHYDNKKEWCKITPFFFSGPEGNRTPVRKPIHLGISHHSHLFDIPSMHRQMTGFAL